MKGCVVIVPAAGSSRRYGALKQFALLNDKPVLWRALQPFIRCRQVRQIRVVVAADQLSGAQSLIEEDNKKIIVLPVGGKTRAQSVYNGAADCSDETWILVHDAARPCLSDAALKRLLDYREQGEGDGAVLALPVNDALKTVADDRVQAVVNRDGVWAMQTPQLLRAGLLKRSLLQYPDAADEAEAAVRCGGVIGVIAGERRNIKITCPEDMDMAAALLQLSEKQESAA